MLKNQNKKGQGVREVQTREGRGGWGGERERERERENSKPLILKDSSDRSIWTYVTASPCYTTNTNKHDYTTNREREREIKNFILQVCSLVSVKT